MIASSIAPRTRAVRTLWALALAACTTLPGLAPFPCAKDGACPEDMLCKAGQCQCPGQGDPCKCGSQCSDDSAHRYCFGGRTYVVCQDPSECNALGAQSGCEFVSGASGPTVCTLVCGPRGPYCSGGDACVSYGCRSGATCPAL